MGLIPDAESRTKILSDFQEKGYVNNVEITAVNADGQTLDLLVNVHPVEIAGSKFMLSTNSDITALKNAERSLRLSEERLRVTLTSIGDAVITVDTSGKVNFLNSAAETLTGWKQTEAAGHPVMSVFRIINELTQVPSEDIVARVLSEGHVIGLSNHTSLITKDERQIPIEDSAAPIKDQSGKVIGVILVFHDVTEKRRAQEALKESEERFRNLVKNAPTAIYEVDFMTRKFITVNDSMCQLSGYSREELLSMDSLNLLDDESKKLFLSRISSGLKGEKVEENVEYTVIAKDGHPIDAVLNLKFTRNKQGIPVEALVVGHDITLRKKAAEEIRKAANALKVSEQRLKYHLENSPLAVIEWDKDLKIIQWSGEAERLFGFTREEVIGIKIYQLNFTYPEDLSLIEKTVSRLTSGIESKVVFRIGTSQRPAKCLTVYGIIQCCWMKKVK